MTDDRKNDARERLAVLKDASAFESLLAHPGWISIYALHTAWVRKHLDELRQVSTANAEEALDALRRWQLAETLVELEATRINETLKLAEEIRGTTTLEDALIMEQYRNEQPESAGDPGSRSGTAGY